MSGSGGGAVAGAGTGASAGTGSPAPPDYAGLCQEARERLAAGDPTGGAAGARRALELAPRGLEAHRLLGLALLALGEARQALGAFQTALAGDPLDVVAQAGVAQAQEQVGGGGAAEAEWLRAWELQPGLEPIEARLQQARRAAGAPPEANGSTPYPLTPAALSRVYLRGGLYEHAVAEARAALSRQADRADLHLTLAEAFWRSGDGATAAAVAEDLLERLPDCAGANLLLAAHWQSVGRDPSPLIARVRAVDPAGRVATRLFGDQAAPPPIDGEGAPLAAPALLEPEPAPVSHPEPAPEAPPEAAQAPGLGFVPQPQPEEPPQLEAEPEREVELGAVPETPARAAGVSGRINAQPGAVFSEGEPEPAGAAGMHLSRAPVRPWTRPPAPAAAVPAAPTPVAPPTSIAAPTRNAPAAPASVPAEPPTQAGAAAPAEGAPQTVQAAQAVPTEGPQLRGVTHVQGAGDALAAGEEALRSGDYVGAIYHFGTALRRLRGAAEP